MPLPITCACGARFDADEASAGREAVCPECREPVPVPAPGGAPPRTSLLALTSAILALVGAFTVVGSALAAVLGLAALARIARHRGRVAGAGLATFGLVAGAALTGLTLFALSTGELFTPGSLALQGRLGDDVDATGPMEVVAARKGFSLTRPGPKWGKARHDRLDDPVAEQLLDEPDLLLIHPSRYLFVEARAADLGVSLDRCQDEILAALRAGRHDLPLFRPRDVRPTVRQTKQLAGGDWAERRELLIDVRCGSQPWTFLVRLQKTANGAVYVTRAYTQRRRFPRAEPELRQALDSFRVLHDR